METLATKHVKALEEHGETAREIQRLEAQLQVAKQAAAQAVGGNSLATGTMADWLTGSERWLRLES